jgi:hypothetical protein
MNSYIRDQQVKSLDYFTLGFSSENFDESKFALRNGGSKSAKQQIVSFDGISHQFLADHINEFMDAPISDPGMVAFAAICSEVTSTHKVILTGDGADELLRGYTIFKYFNFANLVMSLLHFLNPSISKCLITKLLNKEDDGYLGTNQLFLRLLIGSLQKSEDRFAIAMSNSFLHSFLMPESMEPKFKIRTNFVTNSLLVVISEYCIQFFCFQKSSILQKLLSNSNGQHTLAVFEGGGFLKEAACP